MTVRGEARKSSCNGSREVELLREQIGKWHKVLQGGPSMSANAHLAAAGEGVVHRK